MEMNTYEVISRMNKLRKQANQLGYWVFVLLFSFVPVVMLPPVLLWDDESDNNRLLYSFSMFFVYMIVVIITMKLTGVSQKKKLDELKRLYKETFMHGVLEGFFDDVDYRWNVGITQQQFFDTGIFNKNYKPYHYHSEDYLSGTYKGIPFKQVDVEAERKDDDSIITIFSGRLFEFDYSFKQVQSVKVVARPSMLNPHYQTEKHMNIVKMENTEFNKIFDVVTADPHEAFYVITPQVMERLMTLYNKYGSSEIGDGSRADIEGIDRTIAFHFKQDKLYVSIDHMDSFDSNLIQEVDYITEKEKIGKHIQVIIDIIEMLDFH